MSPVELLEHPLAAAATLALVHFLWQGLAITAALVAVVELLGIRRPQPRYLCSLAALVLMALCPLATLAVVGSGEGSGFGVQRAGEQSQVPGPKSKVAVPALTTHHSPLTPHSAIIAAQPYVLTAWLAGVAFFGCRLLMGVIGVRRLRRQRLPLPRELSERVEQLGRRLGMRARSLVFLSRKVGEAMAVGVVKPVVLLPVVWASEMPLVMLEAVIAHELAHLRRRDLWVVLLERVVEALLFYHPAVWWLSSRLRAERELCCDELAVALTGRRLEYVQTLESVARWSARVEPLFAAGIRGERNMQLLHRVRNVLGLSAAGESSRLWPAGLVALLLPLAAWGWSAGLITPQPSVAVADDDREDRDDDDDDDDDDEKEARRGSERDDDDDADERKGRKEGDKEGDDDDDKAEAKDRKRGDGEGEEKEVRQDGDNPEAAARKRERIEQLKFLNKEEEIKRDGVKKEGPKDGEVKKEGAKDPPKKVIKEGAKDPPKKVIKEGAPDKVIKEGEGKLADLAAMVKKLMAENERLRAELAEVRGVKLPAKVKEGASEKEAFIKKPGADREAARDKEAAAKKEALFNELELGAEKEAVREKEAFKRAIAEKEAFARDEDRKREIAEKGDLAKAIELKRAIAEKEEAAARERKEREGAEQKELELRERKIKAVKAHAAEVEERARAAAKKAEAAERAAKEKAAKEKEEKRQ